VQNIDECEEINLDATCQQAFGGIYYATGCWSYGTEGNECIIGALLECAS
jgi:hypothetical protein